MPIVNALFRNTFNHNVATQALKTVSGKKSVADFFTTCTVPLLITFWGSYISLNWIQNQISPPNYILNSDFLEALRVYKDFNNENSLLTKFIQQLQTNPVKSELSTFAQKIDVFSSSQIQTFINNSTEHIVNNENNLVMLSSIVTFACFYCTQDLANISSAR